MQVFTTPEAARTIESDSSIVRAPVGDGSGEGAFFASVMAVVLATVALVSRAGFEDMLIEPVLRFLGLSWLLVHFSWGLRAIARRIVHQPTLESGGRSVLPEVLDQTDPDEKKTAEPWWLSEASLALGGLAAITMLGQLTGYFDWSASYWLAYAGLMVGGMRGLLALPKFAGRMRRSIGLAVAAALLGFYCAGAIWGSGYQNPLFVEQLSAGTAKIDTLFHAAVCNMIRTHGVPSTGLDGVPFLPYHFGSHWLFAQICNLLSVSVIDFYNVGYAIVCAPFGVYCLVTFAREVACGRKDRTEQAAENTGDGIQPPRGTDSRLRPLFWFVLCVGYAGFLPLDAGFATPVARTSILISESYAVAVAIAFLGLAVALRVYRASQAPAQERGVLRAIAAVIVLPALLAVIGLCKVSILLLLAVAGLYGFVRLRMYRSPLFVSGAVSAAVFGAAAFRLSYAPAYEAETGWTPFGFLRGNVEQQWWGAFWLCYFAWLWVLIALRCRELNIGTLADLVAAVRRREMLDVELTVVIAAAGAAPGLLLSQWSSTHYFSEYQHWVALGLVLALIARPSSGSSTELHASTASGWQSIRLRRVAAIGLCLVVAGTMILNTTALMRQTVGINLASRGFPQGGTGIGTKLLSGHFVEAWKTLEEQSTVLRRRLRRKLRLMRILRGFDSLPPSAKRTMALFIPRENHVYWKLLDTPYSPQDGPLVGPALSGLAMIDGLYDPPEGDPWTGYGYQQYPRLTAESGQSLPHLQLGDEALCRRAKTLGFLRVPIVTLDERGRVTTAPSPCP